MGDRINEGFFYKKMYGLFAGPKKVALKLYILFSRACSSFSPPFPRIFEQKSVTSPYNPCKGETQRQSGWVAEISRGVGMDFPG